MALTCYELALTFSNRIIINATQACIVLIQLLAVVCVVIMYYVTLIVLYLNNY